MPDKEARRQQLLANIEQEKLMLAAAPKEAEDWILRKLENELTAYSEQENRLKNLGWDGIDLEINAIYMGKIIASIAAVKQAFGRKE